MKTLLTLLISCLSCCAQFDFSSDTRGYSIRSLGSSASTTGDASETIAAYTPRLNTMLIAIVVNTKAATPDAPSLTGNSLTWTKTFDTNYLSTHRMTVWYAKAVSGMTRGTLVASTGAVNQTGWAMGLVEIEGCYDTFVFPSANHCMIQSVNANVSGGTSITATFAALHGGTLCIGLLGANLNGTAMTAESGWTELIDINFNNPATEVTVVARNKNTDTTCAISNAGAFSGCIVGIEFSQDGNYP